MSKLYDNTNNRKLAKLKIGTQCYHIKNPHIAVIAIDFKIKMDETPRLGAIPLSGEIQG